MQFVHNVGPDKRAHLCSLIWTFSVCRHILHYTVSTDSVSGQRRPRSACANAQADLGLHCPQIT